MLLMEQETAADMMNDGRAQELADIIHLQRKLQNLEKLHKNTVRNADDLLAVQYRRYDELQAKLNEVLDAIFAYCD